MARTAKRIASGAAAIVSLTFSAATGAMAAGDDALCHKALKGIGHPHGIKTVAQLNAVSAWTEAARQFGNHYAMWHNADRATIACETFNRGKPCLPRGEQAEASR